MTELLMNDLNLVCDLQVEKCFILTGFYLDVADLDSIRDVLTPDDPNVGAEGRFEGVPVFKRVDFDRGHNEVVKRDTLGAVQYTFVKMGVVN